MRKTSFFTLNSQWHNFSPTQLFGISSSDWASRGMAVYKIPVLTCYGFVAQGLKRIFCAFSLFYRGCRAGCSPYLRSQLTLPCYCPPALVAPVDLSPKWLRTIIFFQLFSTLKVGLRPSLMLEFCQFAMSLHLSLRDPDASVCNEFAPLLKRP